MLVFRLDIREFSKFQGSIQTSPIPKSLRKLVLDVANTLEETRNVIETVWDMLGRSNGLRCCISIMDKDIHPVLLSGLELRSRRHMIDLSWVASVALCLLPFTVSQRG